MNKEIIRFLKRNNNDSLLVERKIIYQYLKAKGIDYKSNNIIRQYLASVELDDVANSEDSISYDNISLTSMNELLVVMEQLVSDADKKMNGVVYTPYLIKKYMISEMNISIINNNVRICDPSCGCGSFLVSIAEYLHNKFSLNFDIIFRDFIYGVDILEHNIEKSRVLLTILALEYGENYEDSFNLIAANSLSLNWNQQFPSVFDNGGFDYVVGNPPYVSLKNMSEDVKSSLVTWKTANHGNTDLYIVFYELALSLLNDTGIIGYITINSFFSSLNARGLRRLIKESNVQFQIYNFADKQLFENVQSYTCISIIKKHNDDHSIIIKYDSELGDDGKIATDKRRKVTVVLDNYEEEPWLLIGKTQLETIKKLQRFKHKLSDYAIKNGIATLKNDVFFFTPTRFDDIYYYFSKNDIEYKVEKSICRDIIKPNIIKVEEDLKAKMEKAIFPYKKINDEIICYTEDEFKDLFPHAYRYLYERKEVLSNRDKGAKEYEQWFAYGRSQGLNPKGIKVLIPYIAEHPVAVICTDVDLLYYCGNAIYVSCVEEAYFLKKIIESSMFEFYVRTTSKPYSSGFYSLSKAYIKEFSIPEFTPDEYQVICHGTQQDVNILLKKKYNVKI